MANLPNFHPALQITREYRLLRHSSRIFAILLCSMASLFCSISAGKSGGDGGGGDSGGESSSPTPPPAAPNCAEAPLNPACFSIENFRVRESGTVGSYRIEWDVVRGADQYEWQEATAPAGAWGSSNQVNTARVSVTGRAAGTTYRYRVRACRNALCGSYSSEIRYYVGAFMAPVNITISLQNADSQTFQITWDASPEASITQYRVRRCATDPCSDGGSVSYTTSTIYVDNAGTYDTVYYTVSSCAAQDRCGIYSSAQRAAFLVAPAPVLAAPTIANQGFNVSWTAPTIDPAQSPAVTRYLLQYKAASTPNYPEPTATDGTAACQSGSNTSTVGCVGISSATQGMITGLTNGVAYNVRVISVNAIGWENTSLSNVEDVTPGRVPNAPQSFNLIAGDRSFTANWDAVGNTPADNPANGGYAITKYILVYKNTTDSASYPTLQTGNTVCEDASDAPIANDDNSGCVAIDPINATASVTGLTNGKNYEAKVLAVNGRGAGAYSNEAAARPLVVASAPRNLALMIQATAFTAGWQIPADDGGTAITHYVLVYKSGAFAFPVPSGAACPGITNNANRGCVSLAASGALQTSISALINGRSYDVQLRAVSAGNLGAAAAGSVIPGAAPVAVSGLNLAVDDQSFTANWDAVGNTPADNPANGGYALTKYILVYKNTTDSANYLTLTSANTACPSIANDADSGCVEVATGDPINATASVTGLTNGKNYEAKVLAVNARGAGAYSATENVTPGTPPAAVAGLSLTLADKSFTASWTAPTENGYALTKYILVYKNTTDSASYPTLQTGNTVCEDVSDAPIANDADSGCVEVAASNTTASVGGLTNGKNYDAKVLAVNARGAGAYSAAENVTPGDVPDVITDLSLGAGNQNFTASWTAPTENGYALTKYILVYKNRTDSASYPTLQTGNTLCEDVSDAPIANDADSGCVEVAASNTTASVGGLTNGKTYEAKVLAVNALGAAANYSAPETVAPDTVPDIVTNLNLTIGDQNFTASWAAPNDNGYALTKYILVYKNTTDSASYPILTSANTACPSITNNANRGCVEVAASNTTFSVAGLTNGKNYEAKVLAVSGRGAGAYSVAASITPGAAPAAISGLSLAADNQSFAASWDAVGNTPAGNPANGGYAVTKYILVYKNTTDSASYPTLTSANTACPSIANDANRGCIEVAASNTTFSVTGLTNGKNYEAKVLAVNVRGAGAYGAEAAVIVGAPPVAVSGLNLARGDRSFMVNWAVSNDNGYALTKYILVYKNTTASASYPMLTSANTACPSITNDGNRGCIAITAGSPINTTANVTGLTNGNEYEVKVLAVNGRGAGDYSAPATITPTVVPGVIAAAGITFMPDLTMFAASWTAPLNNGTPITKYILVYRNVTDGASYPTLEASNSVCEDGANMAIASTPANGCIEVTTGSPIIDTTATVTNLSIGADYEVKILATNSLGGGAFSAPRTVTVSRQPATPQNLALQSLTGKFIATWNAVSHLPADNPPNGGILVQRYILLYRNFSNGANYPSLRAGNRDCVNSGNVRIANNASRGCIAVNGTSSTPPTTTAIGDSLTNGQTYEAKILAVNSIGASGYSSSVRVAPSGAPDAPSGFALTLGNSSFASNWSAPADNGATITKYILLYRNVTDSVSYPTLQTGNTVCEDTSDTTITNNANSGCVEVAASDTTFSVTGLTNGKNYEAKVLAVNAQGAGSFAAVKTVMPGRAPSAPQNLALSSASRQFTATWDAVDALPANDPNNGGYRVEAYILVYRNVTDKR